MVRVDEVGRPGFGEAVPCQCRHTVNAHRRRQRLAKIDGLETDDERSLRFDQLLPRNNAEALAAVRQAVAERRGLITLTGRPGLGKTALLICAVNEVREAGTPGVYSTVTDLLDYLRQAFDPKQAGLSFDSRWDLLVNADVLAVDEMDEFNTTGWAMERFLRLIDQRWRHIDERLTLLATNSPIHQLPDKVASRLHDGRGRVIAMQGPDLRPFKEW